jgi:hypothetical protein
MRSFHYPGFNGGGSFLSLDEESVLKEDIASLTVENAEEIDHTSYTRRALDAARAFLEYLLTEPGKPFVPAGFYVQYYLKMCS